MNTYQSVQTFFISDDGGSFLGFTHLLFNKRPRLGTSRADVKILDTCGIVHGERFDYMDCPVASRWTLIRAGT